MKAKTQDYLKHLFLTLPLALTVSGCSTVTYVEPTSGPVARVRFVSDSTGNTIVRSYASTNCDGENEMMRLRNGFLFNSEPKRLGIPLWNYHENAGKEFLISSNKPQIYMFDGGLVQGRKIIHCGVPIKLMFETNKDYEVSYTLADSKCFVDVSEIKKNASGQPEKVLLQRKDNTLGSEFSQACVDQFKKLRW